MTTQTPTSIVEIIKGVILFLIVAKYIYTVLGSKLKKHRTAAVKEAN